MCYSSFTHGEPAAKPILDKCIELHQTHPGSTMKVCVSPHGVYPTNATLPGAHRGSVARATRGLYEELEELYQRDDIRTLHLVYDEMKPRLFKSVGTYSRDDYEFKFDNIHLHPVACVQKSQRIATCH